MTKHHRALAKCGVFDGPDDNEAFILGLATEYKASFVDIRYCAYRDRVLLRNNYFPEVESALKNLRCTEERARKLQKEVSAENSKNRSRTKSSPTKTLLAEVKRHVKELKARVKEAEALYKEETDLVYEVWDGTSKERKDKFKREEKLAAYEAFCRSIDTDGWSEYQKEYLDTLIEEGLAKKKLAYSFRKRGLGTDTQKSIKDAAKKIKLEWARFPEVKPVRNIVTQFKNGGYTFDQLLTGRCSDLILTQDQDNIYFVEQQIGSSQKKITLSYRVHIHRPFPRGALLQSWWFSRDEFGNATVVPKFSTPERLGEPTGKGSMTYDLGYTELLDGSLEIARLLGTHINESVILPARMVWDIRALSRAQKLVDKNIKSEFEKRAWNVRRTFFKN